VVNWQIIGTTSGISGSLFSVTQRKRGQEWVQKKTTRETSNGLLRSECKAWKRFPSFRNYWIKKIRDRRALSVLAKMKREAVAPIGQGEGELRKETMRKAINREGTLLSFM